MWGVSKRAKTIMSIGLGDFALRPERAAYEGECGDQSYNWKSVCYTWAATHRQQSFGVGFPTTHILGSIVRTQQHTFALFVHSIRTMVLYQPPART